MIKRIKLINYTVGILFIVMSFMAQAEIELTTNANDRGWVGVDDPIEVRIIEDNAARRSGTVRIFIGVEDLTPLFVERMPGKYRKLQGVLPLPSGEQEVIVFRVTRDNHWQELGRSTIQVLTSTGLERLNVTPRITLANKSQWQEGNSGDAIPPERDKFHDLTMDAGIDIAGSYQNDEFNISANFVGASYQPETLRFSQKGNDAPKIDLTEYLATYTRNNVGIEAGSISYGNNPLLLDNFATRGVKANYRINSMFDVSFGVQNGTEIVGFDRLSGITENDHRVTGATIGLDVFPDDPGRLRTELTYMNASVRAENNFDSGEVPDAEKSDGFGLRITGNAFTGRLRGDVNFARASYTNPVDPFLDFGFGDLLPVEKTTNNARRGEIAYDLINDMTLGEATPVTLSAVYIYEEIDPEYKTLGAFPNADRLSQSMALSAMFGSVGAQLRTEESEDNLDNVPTILKTRTRIQSFNLNMPLAELLGDTDGSNYWPSVAINKERIHQFAINDPDAALSGFNGGSQLPNQISDTTAVNMNWSSSRWDLTYGYTKSKQDNRQPGREAADFTTTGNQLSLNLRPQESISVEFSLGKNINEDVENNLSAYQRTHGVLFNWLFFRKWSVAVNYSASNETDSQSNAKSNSINSDTQLSYQFEVSTGAKKLPGQAFVRYAKQSSDSEDNIFGFNTRANSWNVNTGVSVSLF